MAIIIYIKKRFPNDAPTDAYLADALSAYGKTQRVPCSGAAVRRTARGKPYTDCPDVHISISHTKTHLFTAVGNVPFGIDAEPIGRTLSRQTAVCRRFFSPKEQQALAESADFTADFLWLWVKKEAFLKYRGTGLSDLKKADTTRLAGRFETFCAAGHQIAVYTEMDVGKIEIQDQINP